MVEIGKPQTFSFDRASGWDAVSIVQFRNSSAPSLSGFVFDAIRYMPGRRLMRLGNRAHEVSIGDEGGNDVFPGPCNANYS